MKHVFVLFLCSWLTLSHGAAWEQNVSTDRHRVNIKFSGMVEHMPMRGFVPIRIHVHNRAATASTWDFRFASGLGWNMDQGATHTQFRAQLDGREERVFEIMVPVHSSHAGGSNPRLQVMTSGPGINNANTSLMSSGSWRSTERYYAISRSLAGRNQSMLQQALAAGSRRGGDNTVSTISLSDLSDDLRAYSGIDVLILSVEEWNRLERNHRFLLRQWVARGGQMFLASAGERPVPLDVPGWGSAPVAFGWGQFQPLSMNGDQFNPNVVKTRTESFVGSYPLDDTGSFQSVGWKLRREIPDLNPPLGLLFLFVIIIAVLLGPVNVITAFRKKQAVRLLWVTPLASVALSLVLIAGIVLVDGFGGYGHRVATVFLMPGENIEIVHQEQVARTGVLLRRSFDVAPGTVMLPLNTENLNRSQGNFQMDGTRWDGDWFRSRSIQGQILQNARPSRGRIEVIPGPDGPQIFSEVDAHLQTVFLKDSAGSYWTATDLHAGQRKALRATTQAEARAFVDSLRLRRDERVVPVQDNGSFIAIAAPVRERFLPSYGAIRWRSEQLRYTGMIQERSTP